MSELGKSTSREKNQPQIKKSHAKITVGGLDEIDPTKEHKVLRTNWNLEEDSSLEPTKRNILRIAAKLFDPLPLISPVMVLLRMLLQELCLNKCEWDSLIPQPGRNRLQKWVATTSWKKKEE